MVLSNASPARRTAGNENTGLLKILAMAFMVVDHVGAAFFPQARELRMLGRITFPLFAWCLCVGACHTRSIWKYALRLLLAGIGSQPFFVFGMKHAWLELNVFFELLLGLLGIAAIRENRWGSRWWGPALALAVSCAVNLSSSYGFKGLLLIWLLYVCRNDRPALAAGMGAFCLYWGQGTAALTQFAGLEWPRTVSFLPYSGSLLADTARVQFWAVLSLPLILWPMKSRLRLPKWTPYAFYPAHLLVIGLIRRWDEIGAWLSRWR